MALLLNQYGCFLIKYAHVTIINETLQFKRDLASLAEWQKFIAHNYNRAEITLQTRRN